MDFKQTQQAYVRLKDQLEHGRVTAEEFETRVNEMVVTDSAGVLWQIGVKTGKWYRFDDQTWVEDVPREFERSSTAAPAKPAFVPSPVSPPPPFVSQSEPVYPSPKQPKRNFWVSGCLIAGVLGLCCLVVAVGGWLVWHNNPLPLPSALPIIPPLVPPSLVSPEPGFTAGPGFPPDLIQFQDDFSNPNSGWDDGVKEDYATHYMGGSYCIWRRDSNGYTWANPYMDFPGDVHVEVDARKTSGSQYDEYGVICRYVKNSDGTHSYYYFAIAIDGLGVIYKIDHDEKSLIITDPPTNRSDVIRPGDQVNRIRADCIGDTLTLYVNGQSLISAVDSSFSSGDVGLRADSETGGTEVIFDNFIVYKPGY